MFNPSREQVRQFFCESWRKYRERQILEGAEATAADLITEHPEYHALLENPQAAVEQEFTPEGVTRDHGMPGRSAVAFSARRHRSGWRSLSRVCTEEIRKSGSRQPGLFAGQAVALISFTRLVSAGI